MPSTAKNVLGGPLQSCSTKPLTGFYRDGCCNTGPEDEGLHTICCQVTAEFLAHQQYIGNDLRFHSGGFALKLSGLIVLTNAIGVALFVGYRRRARTTAPAHGPGA